MNFVFEVFKTNIGYLENLIKNPMFQRGEATVNFIQEHPELLILPRRLDRSNKLLRFLAHTIVNGNSDVKSIDPTKTFRKPVVPDFDVSKPFPRGTKDILNDLGPEKFAQWLKGQKAIHYTDTTFRDAHQSLLATRVRTYDLQAVAESYARNLGGNVFSVEMWGGATYDVSMRFLKENPWRRLEILREAMPNVLLQMLIRGSNAVGYTSYSK